jgi:glutathione synthase
MANGTRRPSVDGRGESIEIIGAGQLDDAASVRPHIGQRAVAFRKTRPMPLRVAIQMDPIESVNIDGDSSFVMGLSAEARGHTLWHYHPRQLSLRDGKAMARARPMTLRRKKGDHFTLGDEEVIELSSLDVILMRQDPPFDMAYITATHILETVHPKTLVVNDPVHVRNAPEKLFVTQFPDLMPPTIITSDRREIMEFRDHHKDIIVKPLFGNGGAGVFHITPGDENLGALLEMFTQFYREPIQVQRYVPEVRQGDKRIILIDGEAVGAINRVPAAGEARSNMHVGGRPEKSSLTPRDRQICDTIGSVLRERGMIFVGIDVIGDYLTEINVTSPTGLQEINRFDKVVLEDRIWDAIEKRLGRK